MLNSPGEVATEAERAATAVAPGFVLVRIAGVHAPSVLAPSVGKTNRRNATRHEEDYDHRKCQTSKMSGRVHFNRISDSSAMVKGNTCGSHLLR